MDPTDQENLDLYSRAVRPGSNSRYLFLSGLLI